MSFRTLASRKSILAAALSLGLALAPAFAEAKAGGGSSFGSRGTRTFSPPPMTNTAPRSAAPLERSATPQSAPSSSFAPRPQPSMGLFGSSFGRGLLGGFIGAGLFGLLFGHGLCGGLGGLMSIFGLLLQIGLVVMLARLALAWFQNRQQPAMAGANARQAFGGGPFPGATPAGGGAPQSTPLNVSPADFNAFERRLGEIQLAYGEEDQVRLRTLATAEMAGYFAEQFAENARVGAVNRVSSPKLLQGDLSEAWREGGNDFATVAMRFSVIDVMVDRASGRVVSGDAHVPSESTEVWTFTRPSGAGPDAWVLSAIQQA